jgi:hypothetical protein
MAKVTDYKQQSRSSTDQVANRERLYELFRARPIPDDQLMVNLGLYMRAPALARVLWIDELYRMVLDVPGAIMEFGVWWGQTLALCESFRAIHEPYNHARRFVGFDTFAGYPSVSSKDVASETIKVGGYTVSEGYQPYLEAVLDYHQHENVVPNIRKWELVAGDVTKTVGPYIEKHPEMVVALAIFDLALYEPTKRALEAIKPRLIKGSVVAFDELNCAEYPGETQAVREVLGLDRYPIRRSRYLPDRSYMVIE